MNTLPSLSKLINNTLDVHSQAYNAFEKLTKNYHNLLNLPAPLDPGKMAVTLGLAYHHHLTGSQAVDGLTDLAQKLTDINQTFLNQLSEHTPIPIKDKRFQHPAWSYHPAFAWVHQSYQVVCHYWRQQLETSSGLDEKTQRQARFYLNYLLDAFAPTNVPWLNPEVIQHTVATQGQNLLEGAQKFFEDVSENQGFWQVRTSHPTAFRVGDNLASTPGKVVFRNELVEIIRFTPTTPYVHATPLLIVAPWIKKYYILDLQQHNSFVRWAVDQGFQVFITSWRNPGPELRHKGWEDYVAQGFLEPLAVIREATQVKKVHVIGYCIAGTLLASAAAYLAKKRKSPIKSLTLLTTMTDFSDAGELGNFIDEEYIQQVEAYLKQAGYMDQRALSQVFSLLSANNMIWNFVVRNYFLNQDPPPFDILSWNSDDTRLTEEMQRFILHSLYLKNRLCERNGIKIDNSRVDLRRVKVPVYILSTKDDHITPWRSTYAATQLYSGPITFVLGGSGHTAGVVNAPAQNKYQYWTNDTLPEDPSAWFEGAQAHPGSWWSHWRQWIGTFEDEQVKAKGSWSFKTYRSLGNAPGTYVFER